MSDTYNHIRRYDNVWTYADDMRRESGENPVDILVASNMVPVETGKQSEHEC